MIVGRFSANASINYIKISTAASINVGNSSGRTAIILSTILITAFMNSGRIVFNRFGNASTITGAKPLISLPTPFKAISILGKMFSPKVETL